MRVGRRCLEVVLLVVLAGPGPQAWALGREGQIRDFRHTVWCQREGAPAGIGPIVQGTDGYLWLGTATSGVVRFDGLRFERFDFPRVDGIPSTSVTRLLAPRDGGLWAAFSLGGLAYMKDGRTTLLPNIDGMPRGAVAALAQGPDGTIWVGTTGGLWRRDGTGWKSLGLEWGLVEDVVTSILFDDTGTLWIASGRNTYSLAPGAKRFEQRAALSGDPLVQAPNGDIWTRPLTGTSWRRIHRAPPGRKVAPALSRHIGMAFDRGGTTWVKFPNALRRITDPASRADSDLLEDSTIPDVFGAQEGLTPPFGETGVLVDREDNVWITSGDCMERFAESNVRQVVPSRATEHLALTYSSPTILPADDGGLWIAHDNDDAVWRYDGGATFTRFAQAGHVWGGHRGRDGTVWFIGDGQTWRTWRYRGGRFSGPSSSPLSADTVFRAVTQDLQGRLWLASGDQTFRQSGDKWEDVAASPVPLGHASVLHTDARGRIWAGYISGQVSVQEGGRGRMFMKDEAPGIGSVNVISSRGDRVWFAGMSGIALYDGERFRTIRAAPQSPLEKVIGIVEAANGDLWLGGAEGIVHMSAQSVERAFREPSAEPQVEVFSASDGIKGAIVSDGFERLIEGTDGRIWLSTTAGVYLLDPARMHRNTVPPIVQVIRLTIDGKAHVPTDGMALPPNTTGLRIAYAGLSLTAAEKVRYRYQLEGVDAGWQDARERNEVFYTGLRPGDYRFRVVASNNDGVWNETGATLNFRIPPTFTQTGWFYALCVMAALAVAWGVVRIRVRQVAARLRTRLEARQAERERIARELHDTLLQSTQGLILRFHAVADAMGTNDPGRQQLEDTLRRADEVMAEGRDRVVSLRATSERPGDLHAAIVAGTDALARDREAQLQVQTEGDARPLNRKVLDEAHRIAHEAIANAFQHARAESITVRVIYHDDRLQLLVQDDGVGIDAPTLEHGKPRHWGLKGMRERALGIGGELDIRSPPEGGTEVDLSVPAGQAYARAHRRWLPWRRAD